MKIEKMYITNFRCYKERTEISFEDFTTIIGKNDCGKSTIFAALDIFFNDGKGTIKLDDDDLCIKHDENDDTIIIEVIFNDLPDKIVLDSTYNSDLLSEHLLTLDGKFHIIKRFRKRTVTTTVYANYPQVEEMNFHSMKIAELRKYAESNNISCEDNRVSSLIRKAIFSNVTEFSDREIEVDKESGKQIMEAIQYYLPHYYLFQTDRKNDENDDEIQDPLSIAIDEALMAEDIQVLLQQVYDKIFDSTMELMGNTLDKLSEMNIELANELTPDIAKPTWKKALKIGLNTDQIPINKRGSGVRRLILLNFFRAKAEKKLSEELKSNIIYAIEEPETALHPDQQKMLIDCFMKLSKRGNTQVFITTHSPEIAQLAPIDSLRFVTNVNKVPVIKTSDDSILQEICDELGVFPNVRDINKVKVVIYVEGPTDKLFFDNVTTIECLKNIIDLKKDNIIMIPIGGGNLKHWVSNQYLKKLKLNEIHIYDSDIGSNKEHKYKAEIDEIKRRDNAEAFETSLREIENYISPSILKRLDGFEDIVELGDDWKTVDVPQKYAEYIHGKSESPKKWEELDEEQKGRKVSAAKRSIANNLYKEITKDTLEEIGVLDEVKSWFSAIKKFSD